MKTSNNRVDEIIRKLIRCTEMNGADTYVHDSLQKLLVVFDFDWAIEAWEKPGMYCIETYTTCIETYTTTTPSFRIQMTQREGPEDHADGWFVSQSLNIFKIDMAPVLSLTATVMHDGSVELRDGFHNKSFAIIGTLPASIIWEMFLKAKANANARK